MNHADMQFSMGVVGVVVMSLFMPWTVYSFFTFRLKRKKTEYKYMLKQLGYSKGKGPAYVPTLDDEYELRDYFLPVAFAFIITALCATVLVFGPRMMGYPNVSLVLNGPSIDSSTIMSKYKLDKDAVDNLFGMLIIGLAFMGSYIWSIQALFRRLATVDLTPGAYYAVGIRMILSVFAALLLYYFLADGNISGLDESQKHFYNSPSILAIYAFFAGMFPQRALQYLQDKVRFMGTKNKRSADPLPMQMIEGIGLFERTRFVEVGIDNAQNLAKSNFIELIIRTPFNPREIIDWIGQARLYLYFKDDIIHLRKAGIRTVFNLYDLGKENDNLKKISGLSKDVSPEKIKIVFDIVKHDPDINELMRAKRKLIVG